MEMKQIFFAIATLCGIWVSAHSFQMNSTTAQIDTGMVTTTVIPLTNQAPFTNTLVQPTNLTSIQLSNVVTLLLTLQTNIEEVLPVLDLIQSNAVIVSVTPTNRAFAPITANPAGLTPTGAASGTRQTALAVKIGTNTFNIDTSTLQGLFILRFNLQQSLTVLQELNGTTPSATNAPPTPISLIPPPFKNLPPAFTNISSAFTNIPSPVTNFSPGPLTNALAVPFSRTLPIGEPGSVSPF